MSIKRNIVRFVASICMLVFLPLCGCSYAAQLISPGRTVLSSATVTLGPVRSISKGVLEVTDPAVLDAIAQTIGNGNPVQVDALDLPTPALSILANYPDGSSKLYGVYDFAPESGYLYILPPDGDYREVSRQSLVAPLSSDDCAGLYADIMFPSASITAEGKQGELMVTEGAWSYTRLDGSLHTIAPETAPEPFKYALTSPEAPVVELSITPDTLMVTVERDDKTMFSGSAQELASYRMSGGGRYDYTFEAVWSKAALREYQGSATYRFCVDYTPAAGFAISATSSDPGEAVLITATGLEGKEIAVTSPFKFEPEFFDYDGMRVCLFPLSYNNAPNTYTLELSADNAYAKYEITLKDKKFVIQELTVDESVASSTINNNSANAEYDRVIAPLKGIRDPVKYFTGRFIAPVSGDITTEFGSIRTVNGGASSTRHGGMDFAAKRGTKIKAAGAGRVIYAGLLQLTGNTILIEHGFGLKTWYYHMDSLSVKTEDMVKQGDIIGTVGSTGFSTGPHLHFGMSVNGVFINPETAINNELIP